MYKHSRQVAAGRWRASLAANCWLISLCCFCVVSAYGQTAGGKTAEIAGNSGLKLSQQELIRQFEASSDVEYTIGAGDEIEIQVPTHPELQGHHVVGPDGQITLPVVGAVRVSGLTREGAARAIGATFGSYYTDVPVEMQVTKYGSNKVMVVGRVAVPGPIFFETAPTLLEALAKSGAYNPKAGSPATPGAEPVLSRCAVYRGSEEVLWIDLRKLFSSGTSAVDVTLRRGDIVYVPDDQDEQVSVLGQVRRPGAVTLTPQTRLVDVLTLAGGLTDDAAGNNIRIVRPSTGQTREVAFRDLVKPTGSRDAGDTALENGDVIYVPQSGFAKVAYVFQKLSPMGTLLMFGAIAAGR
jgi:polysaccharide export outer membrane protein